jgi:hypothetical protein
LFTKLTTGSGVVSAAIHEVGEAGLCLENPEVEVTAIPIRRHSAPQVANCQISDISVQDWLSDDESDSEECVSSGLVLDPSQTQTTPLPTTHGLTEATTVNNLIPSPQSAPLDMTNSIASVVYVIRLSPPLGKFDVAKARQLGVTPGPDYKRLQQGESIATLSGLVVQPSDVVAPSPPAPLVLVVSCPDEDALKTLTTNSTIHHHTDASKGCLNLVVHMTPQAIASSSIYINWVATLGDASTTHWIVNEDVCDQRPAFCMATQRHVRIVILV